MELELPPKLQETFKATYELFDEAHLDDLVELAHPDTVFVVGSSEPIRGKEALKKVWMGYFSEYEPLKVRVTTQTWFVSVDRRHATVIYVEHIEHKNKKTGKTSSHEHDCMMYLTLNAQDDWRVGSYLGCTRRVFETFES